MTDDKKRIIEVKLAKIFHTRMKCMKGMKLTFLYFGWDCAFYSEVLRSTLCTLGFFEMTPPIDTFTQRVQFKRYSFYFVYNFRK